jgi:hypothetical protein
VQTITIPYVASDDDGVTIAKWQRLHACVVRTGYARAGLPDGGIMPEKDLRGLLKSLFPNHPLGSWGIHCATREALRLRRQRPDGRMVFGGRKELERRAKGLITNEEWRRRRQSRSIKIVGDRTYAGNRHLTIAPDGLSAGIRFLDQSVTIRLTEMSGAYGHLIRGVAALAAAGEISVSFSLTAECLSITFDEMDLRKLPPGMTLENARHADREALGHKPRGRPRKVTGEHTKAHTFKPLPAELRPVHPEWRPTIPTMTTRAVGVDLNPQWIGITVVEIGSCADARDVNAVHILDHQLIRLDVPIDASTEALATYMARAARMATSLARKWHAANVFHEDGLGKLHWSKRSRGEPAAQTINHWSRNAFIGGLTRRCRLSGLTVCAVWGGYSTTIGNTCFDLPDACASAAEIARRGIAASRGEKDRLPVVPRTVLSLPWKDGKVPDAVAKAMEQAGCWQSVHRAIKAAKIDVRRPHPTLRAADHGPFDHAGRRYAVRREGSRKSGHLTVAAAPTTRVA